MRTGKSLLAGTVVLGALTACGPLLGVEWPQPRTAPAVSETAHVSLVWTTDGSVDPRDSYVEYEATVTLHEPVPGRGVCGTRGADGTGTARVVVALTNRTDLSRDDVAAQRRPQHLRADPLNAGGSLRWAGERWGRDACVDVPDLARVFEDWDEGETRELHGELAGVPLDDPSGHGVELEFVAPDWQLVEGEVATLPVRF
ncbi:hypothetical protein NI17_003925 [Thermobifida halotolerans]|uniref:Lipoprotein n=1 Tax=Thermobifida halotolerans TaxID=483545 RepID=A0AA97LY78_9ACTN|nr:hypothetical protein [Thermobifida halotolerans]UOE20392.1 hypothetical protein NI17_003925 [Thermobifida halotolerans]